jgi:hypothetical protein
MKKLIKKTKKRAMKLAKKAKKSTIKLAKPILGKALAARDTASAILNNKKVTNYGLAAVALAITLFLTAKISNLRGYYTGCIEGASASMYTLFGPDIVTHRGEAFGKMCNALTQVHSDGKTIDQLLPKGHN